MKAEMNRTIEKHKTRLQRWAVLVTGTLTLLGASAVEAASSYYSNSAFTLTWTAYTGPDTLYVNSDGFTDVNTSFTSGVASAVNTPLITSPNGYWATSNSFSLSAVSEGSAGDTVGTAESDLVTRGVIVIRNPSSFTEATVSFSWTLDMSATAAQNGDSPFNDSAGSQAEFSLVDDVGVAVLPAATILSAGALSDSNVFDYKVPAGATRLLTVISRATGNASAQDIPPPPPSSTPADRAQAQVIQPLDNKIIAVGYADNGSDFDFALARYNPDGSLDTAGFGAGTGKVKTHFGFGSDQAFAVALQTDGKIVVAGLARYGSYDRLAVARYNPDGSLDTAGFGGGTGMVTTPIGSGDAVARAVAIQPLDGKIVVAGDAGTASQHDFVVARYNPDGSLDTAGFGSGTGTVITPVGTGDDLARALVIQPSDGKIVVAGSADPGSGTGTDFVLVRYNSDGSVDTTGFGSGGKVAHDFFGGADTAEAMVLDDQGRIVVAGSAFNGANNDMALARFDASGNWDNGFGPGGKPVLDFASGNDYAHALVIDANGKIVVAGHTRNGAFDDFAVTRFASNGDLDTVFGTDGKVTVDFQLKNDQAYAVGIQPDHKILVTGYAVTTNSDDFALARLNP